MFLPHWSVFVEHNFLGFGTNSSSVVACGGACILSGKADLQNVLVGLNYKFQTYVAQTVDRRFSQSQTPSIACSGFFNAGCETPPK